MNPLKKTDKFVYILTLIYIVPFSIILIINFFCSMFQTTYMELYQDVEKPLYKSDHPMILLALLILFIGVSVILFSRFPISLHTTRFLEKSALAFSVICSLLVIFIYRTTVACDSEFLSNIAINFLKGDYSSLSGDDYLVHYPHQLGMIALLEIIYYIFGINNFTVMQFLNVIAIFSVIYFLHRITEELFHDNQVQALSSILCIGALPLYLYSTFIYGDIPSMGFIMPAIYLIIRYLNTKSRKLLIPSALCMTFSILLKSNNSIILAAAVIILILHAIREKETYSVVFALALLIGPWMGNTLINTYYVHVSGIESMPSGIPKIAWIAMGLQENDYIENGWYNSYNWTIYTICGFDTELTTKACINSIKDSLHSFITSPKSAILFFYKKFISQWNDPGFQSQITNEWYSRHRGDQSALALFLIYGNGRMVLEWIMNLYHFFILLGASIFSVRSIKNHSLPSAFLMLCIFGGYFFHMFWEAGGRYGLSYFIMCIPLAASGLGFVLSVILKKPLRK